MAETIDEILAAPGWALAESAQNCLGKMTISGVQGVEYLLERTDLLEPQLL